MEKLHTDLLNEREGKKGKKSKSRDLSKRSLKTHKETDSREPTQKYLKREREGIQKKSKDLSNRCLKTDRETDSREPTQR